MKDIADWSRPIERALHGWPEENDVVISAAGLADVELGLHLLLEVLPEGRAIDVWPLLGGYPYAEVFNPDLDEAGRRRIDNARYYLASLRRKHLWERELQRYMDLDQHYRGFEMEDVQARPRRREPSLSAGRFELYDRVLDTVPAFATRPLPIAGAGEHRFSLADRTHSVRIPEELAAGSVVPQLKLGEVKAGQGKPITVSRSNLRDAARKMDDAERANPLVKPRCWEQSLGDVELAVAELNGFAFTKEWEFTIDGLFHLVGMVGAGKSTIMHLLTYHCTTKLGLKVTLVLGDVADSLRVTDMFNLLGDDRVRAAPVVGRSTRERHIHRLHRRKHTAGASSMLDHADRSFDYLSSACPVDALRGVEDVEPLRLHEAPCTQLKPVAAQAEADPFTEEEPQTPKRVAKPKPHGCPVWNRCPRHHAARRLAEAPVWVATMPGLLHSAVPQHQTEARVRYLEAAADRSDLIIIDEADRIQTQLDVRFAPAATLCGKGEDSWIDWLQRHTIDQISARGRIQLSNHDISTWKRALNTVSSAADRIYSMLNDDAELRQWVSTDYFSAMTLHRELYRDWHPAPSEGGDAESMEADSLFGQVLNDFRDRPIQPRLTVDDDPRRALVKELVDLTNSLVNTELDHDRLRSAIRALTAETPRPAGDTDVERRRFAFTLLVAALDNQLTTLTNMWPRVEAALNLESAGNALTRRPPRDYEPVMAESPMGNVLGYQFTPEEPGPPRHSGALRFFHCSGLGRDLLLRLPKLTADDGRPGPHVMAMSATSWAGTSSRYHMHTPVDAILQPNQDNIDAIRQTAFKREFLLDKEWHPLYLSGQPTPEARTAVLKEMLRQLAIPDRELFGSTSMLQDELESITDPRRRRILLLTGSYDEARTAANYLNGIEEWTGKVTLLIADDADNDDAWFSLRRGDLASYPSIESKILIAPLLAVERGHNIVLGDGTAAIGSVYFLARPHDRPDDINLAIHAINDWAMRFVHGGEFAALRYSHPDPDAAATEFRRLAVRRWRRYLTRRVAWSALNREDKDSFTWDQLVVVWQVIGRLVRGGVPARVKFCDAAFAPGAAADKAGADTPKTSLLKRFEHVLHPYFDPDSAVSASNKTIASALLQPFWDALIDIDNRE